MTLGANTVFSHNTLIRDCWKPTRKKIYYCKIRFGIMGEHIHNVLEDTHYIVRNDRPIVITGTIGEQWVISVEVLKRKYRTAEGNLITDSFLRDLMRSKSSVKIKSVPEKGNNYTNYALGLDIRKYRDIPIITSWGDTLLANRSGTNHSRGDFLVCGMLSNGQPDFNDMWVVNGQVFSETYDIRGFGGVLYKA